MAWTDKKGFMSQVRRVTSPKGGILHFFVTVDLEPLNVIKTQTIFSITLIITITMIITNPKTKIPRLLGLWPGLRPSTDTCPLMHCFTPWRVLAAILLDQWPFGLVNCHWQKAIIWTTDDNKSIIETQHTNAVQQNAQSVDNAANSHEVWRGQERPMETFTQIYMEIDVMKWEFSWWKPNKFRFVCKSN
jgi:hypothetical protein